MCKQAMARIQRPCIVRSWTRVTEPCSGGGEGDRRSFHAACLTNIEGDVPKVVQFQQITMTQIPLLEVVGRRVSEHGSSPPELGNACRLRHVSPPPSVERIPGR